jgi:outer membrane protein OmpA-like peptidoglycan-associated protein
LNKIASIGTQGEFGINPVVADLQLEISDLNLAWFQPFLADILEIIVSDGKFSTTGTLSLSYTEVPGLQAKYRGSAIVADFATKDNTQGDDFVKWKQLLVNGIDVGISPVYVNINEIALEDLDSRIIVNADGSLNLQNIVTADTKTSPEASEPPGAQTESALKATEPKDTETVPVNIGKITCKDGKINFSDRSITPSYSANLVDIQGTVSGLISEETQRANVSFKGKLNSYAPLEITGTINPLMEDLFVDLKVRFKDMDLSPVSPYSGKYVGYKIRKGKLSMDLSYLIDQEKLDSTNDVYIDQFDFGESVESPDSLNLPIKLAVSLLKDRSGEIILRLPVTGRIDDPEFSISGIVLKMIKNILIKAATSPFSLISATFGSGEDLSHFEFDAGSAELTDADKAKLDTLVTALYERPGLQLEVTGFADIEKDRQGLISYRFDKQIKTQKLKKMKKKEAAVVSVDSVMIEPEEYEKYLKMAYRAGKFKKPKNILGITKNIPAPEMEALILENIQVTDDDLRSLANERAQVVKNYILGQGEIEPERLFLIEPQTLTPEKIENLKDSRVDLSFK